MVQGQAARQRWSVLSGWGDASGRSATVTRPDYSTGDQGGGGKRYWRIESFNDHLSTTHADVLRVLRRARENVIAGMIEGNPRPWHELWLQTLRCLCSERWSAISVPPRSTTDLPRSNASATPLIGSQSEPSSPLREIREVAR